MQLLQCTYYAPIVFMYSKWSQYLLVFSKQQRVKVLNCDVTFSQVYIHMMDMRIELPLFRSRQIRYGKRFCDGFKQVGSFALETISLAVLYYTNMDLSIYFELQFVLPPFVCYTLESIVIIAKFIKSFYSELN